MTAIGSLPLLQPVQALPPERLAQFLIVILRVQQLIAASRCFAPDRDIGQARVDFQRCLPPVSRAISALRTWGVIAATTALKPAKTRLAVFENLQGLVHHLQESCEGIPGSLGIKQGKDAKEVTSEAFRRADLLHQSLMEMGECPELPPSMSNLLGRVIFFDAARKAALNDLYRFAVLALNQEKNLPDEPRTLERNAELIFEGVLAAKKTIAEISQPSKELEAGPRQDLLMQLSFSIQNLSVIYAHLRPQEADLSVRTRMEALQRTILQLEDSFRTVSSQGPLDLRCFFTNPPFSFRDLLLSSLRSLATDLAKPPVETPFPGFVPLPFSRELEAPLETGPEETYLTMPLIEKMARRELPLLPPALKLEDAPQFLGYLAAATLRTSARLFCHLRTSSFPPTVAACIRDTLIQRKSLRRLEPPTLDSLIDHLARIAHLVRFVLPHAELDHLSFEEPPQDVAAKVQEAVYLLQKEYPERRPNVQHLLPSQRQQVPARSRSNGASRIPVPRGSLRPSPAPSVGSSPPAPPPPTATSREGRPRTRASDPPPRAVSTGRPRRLSRSLGDAENTLVSVIERMLGGGGVPSPRSGTSTPRSDRSLPENHPEDWLTQTHDAEFRAVEEFDPLEALLEQLRGARDQGREMRSLGPTPRPQEPLDDE